MASTFTPDERRELATRAEINEQYLYQCLTGRREMGAAEAVRVEQAVENKVRRWDVCQKTWHRIWPELIGAEGAPDPATTAPPNTPTPLAPVVAREEPAPTES